MSHAGFALLHETGAHEHPAVIAAEAETFAVVVHSMTIVPCARLMLCAAS